MLSRHRVSRAAIELIKRFEGYRRHAAQLPDGRWTIGYGHTLTAREGAEVSEPDAEALLVYDLISVQHAVNENIYAPVTQNQYDALCSFAFNIGLDNFRRSQVLKRLNAGAAVQAACAMELWRKADFEGERIVVDALVRRRAAEKALFLAPTGDDWVPAPSPIIRPVIDLDALDLVPLRRPVELQTSFEGDQAVARREDLPAPDAATEPTPPEPAAAALTAAAEAISARLESIFPDPGEEPEPQPEPLPQPVEVEPELALELESAAEDAPGEDWRPQADFAPPITALAGPEGAEPEAVEPEPEAEAEVAELELEDPLVGGPLVEPESGPEPLSDAEMEIPRAPLGFEPDEEPAAPEIAPYEFIPARPRPAPRPKEASVVWDLLLALLGLAFFGFGIFWGLNARGGPSGGLVTPIMVAWPAGLAGVGFVVVAVFRMLQRLGREAEQD